MKGLYSFWVWLKEIFGFGNLGAIHAFFFDDINEEKDDKEAG